MKCPCCDGAIEEAAILNDRLRLSPVQRRIFNEVAANNKRGTPVDKLVLAVYSGPDGGPDDAATTIRVHVHFLNKKLAKAGSAVRVRAGHRLGTGYHVVPA